MNNTISNLDDWIYSHRICITRSCIVMTIVAVALAILGMGLQVNHSTMSISMASYMSGAIVQAWSFCGLLAIIRSKKTAIGEDEKTREARLKCFQSQHDVDAPSQKNPSKFLSQLNSQRPLLMRNLEICGKNILW